MTLVLVPAGRGRWRRVTLGIPVPADLFPSLRDRQVRVGDRWFMADRWWRVIEVQA
jgi:hypothetical protein